MLFNHIQKSINICQINQESKMLLLALAALTSPNLTFTPGRKPSQLMHEPQLQSNRQEMPRAMSAAIDSNFIQVLLKAN